MDSDQIAAFQRDGYLLLRGFFDRDETADITRWTEELAEAPEEAGCSTRMPESSSASRISARTMTASTGWSGTAG
jgi:hypothetical protein